MTTKFKKQFLSFNEERFENGLRDLNKQCEEINLSISNAERVLRNENGFSIEEKKQIKNNAFEFLNEFLNEIKPFKNADLDFNLEAIGMTEAKGILYDWKNKTNQWKQSKFELNKLGLFEVIESQINELKEESTSYTTSIEQNMRLEEVKELTIRLNRAFDLGMISVYNRPSIANSIQGIKVDLIAEKQAYGFIIDTKNI